MASPRTEPEQRWLVEGDENHLFTVLKVLCTKADEQVVPLRFFVVVNEERKNVPAMIIENCGPMFERRSQHVALELAPSEQEPIIYVKLGDLRRLYRMLMDHQTSYAERRQLQLFPRQEGSTSWLVVDVADMIGTYTTATHRFRLHGQAVPTPEADRAAQAACWLVDEEGAVTV